jgi:hypothetical protein
MYVGSLPPASIHGTWLENIEVRSADDDTYYDFSALTQITVELRDPVTGFAEMTLTLTNGDVSLPAPGIIQWKSEPESMGLLATKLYEVLIILEDVDEVVPFVIGSISILE